MNETKPAPSKIRPNTFQTPNLLTDDGLLALLTGPETKCYLVIIRKTFGWRKDRDRISKGMIAKLTGLNEGTVDDCMTSLVKFGLVLVTAQNNPENEGLEWEPQMDDQAIDFAGLQNRQSEAKAANKKRLAKARSARGGVVPQPHLVAQPGGGVVPQPPQQPLTTSVLVVVNPALGEISKAYEQEFGGLTPMIADAIKDAVDIYPNDWIPEAMAIAVQANHRSWAYVEGILKNCKAKNIRPALNKLEKAKGKKTGEAKPNPYTPEFYADLHEKAKKEFVVT